MLSSFNFIKWLYFSLLVIMFGSAFYFIEISLFSFTPLQIAFYRVFIASIMLTIYSLLNNYRFNFIKKNFILLFILGLSGTSIPFFLISWAQIAISSSETGILIGFMPLFTIIGSHYIFKYEKLNFWKILGFVIGFIGLFILLFNNNDSTHYLSNMLSKLAVIFGAFFYALNALLVKKIKNVNAIPLSAVVMIFSSIQLLALFPFMEETNILFQNYELRSLFSLIIMGIFSTALATVIYYKIINDYGPNFLSLVNYPIPVFAFFVGVIFLNENISFYSIVSLLLVIIAIYVSQKK